MTARSQGLRAWLLQRLSAVYLAVFIIVVLLRFVSSPPQSYQEWQSWITQPTISIATAIFFMALLLHAWVGLRDVFIDYVSPFAIRFVLLVLLALGLVGMGLWAVRILLVGSS